MAAPGGDGARTQGQEAQPPASVRFGMASMASEPIKVELDGIKARTSSVAGGDFLLNDGHSKYLSHSRSSVPLRTISSGI